LSKQQDVLLAAIAMERAEAIWGTNCTMHTPIQHSIHLLSSSVSQPGPSSYGQLEKGSSQGVRLQSGPFYRYLACCVELRS